MLFLIAVGCERARPPVATLVVAQVAEPRSLDPQVTTALNDFRILVNVFEGLVRYRLGTLEPVPALAESWQISEDGRVYTFKLKGGVRFHDGSRFDAEAVRFNFERLLDPEHPYHDTGPFPLAFFFDAVESIEVLDPLRVRFRLAQPFAPFLSNLAYPAGLIVSPAAIERWGDEVGRHPSGTGPFRFVDWRPGERVRLERFPDYHGMHEGRLAARREGRPMDQQAGQETDQGKDQITGQIADKQAGRETNQIADQIAGQQEGAPGGEEPARSGGERDCDERGALVQTLIFRPITDPMTRVAELLTGAVDLALELSPDNVAAFRARAGFTVLEATGPHLWFLILNTREGPLGDVRVRRAVNLAIDPRVLAEDVLRETAVPAAGPVPAAFGWANNPKVRPYRQDRAAARRLLAAAGYEDGLRLRFLVPRGGSGMLDPVAMAMAIQGDLDRIGIDAEIRSYEWNAYLARVNQGLDADADMAEMAWMTNDPDTLPYLALRCDASPEQGGFNSGYYCSPRVDELIAQARRATDRDERARLYHQLEREVHKDAPWAVIASWRQNLVARAEVSGLQLEPSFFLRLEEVAKGSCRGGDGGGAKPQ
ncbi:MAG: ABC transporter substrate-binding protein [Halochromatium sp.]